MQANVLITRLLSSWYYIHWLRYFSSFTMRLIEKSNECISTNGNKNLNGSHDETQRLHMLDDEIQERRDNILAFSAISTADSSDAIRRYAIRVRNALNEIEKNRTLIWKQLKEVLRMKKSLHSGIQNFRRQSTPYLIYSSTTMHTTQQQTSMSLEQYCTQEIIYGNVLNMPSLTSKRASNEDLYSSRKEKILKTFSKLADLYNNFIDTATLYGKIIISERNLPLDQKTIKPAAELGGIAGITF